MGGAAIGIGVTAYIKLKLETSMVAYAVLNSVSLIIAFFCLYAIATSNIKHLKFFFIWKSIEAIIVPLFELTILIISASDK